MYLSKSFVIAALAAAGVLTAPSFARADITIQVEEITAGGAQVGTPITVAGIGTSLSTGSGNTLNFTINNVSTGVSSSSNNSYISSALNLTLSNFNSTDGLQITITYTGLSNVNPTAPATVTTQVSSTNTTTPASPSSTFTVTSSTSVSDTNTPPNVLGTTGNSIAAATNSSGGSGSTTSANISSLPGTYSMTETITAFVTVPAGTTVTGGVGGSISSDIVPGAAVPAPGGLALVAVGLPLLGLRRVFGRKAAA